MFFLFSSFKKKDTLPVPEPVFHQIVTKPVNRPKREISKKFTILTPPNYLKEDMEKPENESINKNEQDLQQQEGGVQTSLQKDPFEENKVLDISIDPNPDKRKSTVLSKQLSLSNFALDYDELIPNKSEWIIPSKKTAILVVNFFSKTVGSFDTKFDFEAFFSTKQYSLNLNGKSDFPMISTMPKNIFWNFRKNRPANPPESYLSKSFIYSENVFEFGPLLINKSVENKDDPAVKNVNSATFRITNQGKFICELKFDLMSSVINTQDNPLYKKGVFFFSPETLELNINECKEIRVWALPNEALKFKDELIIMIKDNPQPVLLPIQCTGQKPVVNIVEGENLIFKRLLINQSGKKQIVLKNNCAIQVKWRLKGLENFPKEFTIVNTSGDLKPTQETVIEVFFKAIKQMKFQQKLTLEVYDKENMNIFQEPRIINIETEAFEISVAFKFPLSGNEEHILDSGNGKPAEGRPDQLLDFGAVKVGEIKEQTFIVKNIGLYNIKYNFNIKKRLFRENFKIETQEAELTPGQEKVISIRFSSKSEIKLTTNNNTTDIIMEILEGQTTELFRPVPINVSVNSVFSKYSIHPVKNINFGPMQFNEGKVRTFELKNEGIFEFNYTIFDYFNEESRSNIKAATEKYLEELRAAGEDKITGKGDKKNIKKEKPPPKKDLKKGVDPTQMKIGQWNISPYQGSIPPDQSITVEVAFNGLGQKIYEQKLGIDIQGRF